MSTSIQPAGEMLRLLDDKECARVSSRVRQLRKHWHQRNPKAPFYTLGAASYLDASAPGHDTRYRDLAQRLNPILWDAFGWLYKRLAKALEQQLEAPVRYDEHLALPGFHLFLAHPQWAKTVASIHIDQQYMNIDWSAFQIEGEMQAKQQISLTLAIDLPAGGGGLRLWEIDRYQVLKLSREERQSLRQKHSEPHFLAYHPGSLVVHSGHQLHQIAPMPDMAENEQRLTLQAHALPLREGWVVYW